MRVASISHRLAAVFFGLVATGLHAGTTAGNAPVAAEAHPMAAFLLLLGVLIAVARLGALVME